MIGNIPCPKAPGFAVPWDELDGQFEWVRALRGCPQDPIFHAEGDVWIHTRLVLESLVTLPGWRSLPEHERDLVFVAALLHDVAKPARTKTEPDGRISARGHSSHGAVMARQLLWRMNVPVATREAICAIIRWHQIPFFLIERDDAQRVMATVTQTARADHLALVTEADARGRTCADGQRLLDNIELFRQFCADAGCSSSAFAFPSAHARVKYLRNESNDPSYRPHETFSCDVVFMSGLPGSGKDTWIRRTLPTWPVVSLDRLREELDVDPGEAQGGVVAAAREEARVHLRAKRSFVWNATNLSRQLRQGLLSLFYDYGARVRIVARESKATTLFAQNREREAVVPERVILRLLDRWEFPDLTEAHAVEVAEEDLRS